MNELNVSVVKFGLLPEPVPLVDKLENGISSRTVTALDESSLTNCNTSFGTVEPVDKLYDKSNSISVITFPTKV